MAYLHCHSCYWSQDDFYSRSYNPLTKLWRDFKWLWKPYRFQIDSHCINDLTKYTHIPVYVWNKNTVFSWNWLLLETVKDIKVALETKWWTWESWKKVKDTAVCPKCGDKNWDID